MTNSEAVILPMSSEYYKQGYKQGVSDVLDKIKVEIEQKCCITVGRENDPAITLYDVFQIIDKYKRESEE